MIWNDLLCFLAISAAFSFTCLFLIPPASASISIHQGETAYLGEYIDISQVIAFPNFALAHCSDEMPGCVPPDQVITVTGYMYNYYLDPAVWKVGTYYRYDGEWHRGENSMGMYVRAGTRPVPVVNVTPNVTPNVTVEVSPVLNKTNILLARGDTLNYAYAVTNDKGNGWVWLFGGGKELLGMPMNKTGINVQSYTFTNKTTQSLSLGEYTGYLQFAGLNQKQDVFYTSGNVLDSIYKKLPQTNLSDLPYTLYQSAFEKMQYNKEFSDDILVPIKVTIKDPEMRIIDYFEDGDTIYVAGFTTLSNDTKITCIVDPEHWVGESEKRLNTYPVIITGGIDREREFTVQMKLKWDELSIGEHIIQFNVNDKGLSMQFEKEFRVTNTYVMPAPTPEAVKVVVDEYGNHRIIPTPTATPTPIITPCPSIAPTAEPTSVPVVVQTTTVPVATATPVPTATTYVVPTSPLLGILALGLIFAWWRIKC